MPEITLPAGACDRCARRHVADQLRAIGGEIERLGRLCDQAVARGQLDRARELQLRAMTLLYSAYQDADFALRLRSGARTTTVGPYTWYRTEPSA